MSYVNCARFAKEQNLVAIQVEEEIYYEVCKDISQVSKHIYVCACVRVLEYVRLIVYNVHVNVCVCLIVRVCMKSC